MEWENEFSDLFPDCEVGAIPALGSAYNVPTYVDARFLEDKEIYLNAGGHRESVKISVPDFVRVAQAEIADLSTK